MTLDLTPEKWVSRLSGMLETQAPEIERFNNHYDLQQPLSYMHPELWMQVSQRIKPVLIAWPQVVVDSIEERLCVEGFRWDRQSRDDDLLWEWWQANNLDEGSEQEHLESLISGRGYVIVGVDPDDSTLPKITVESPLQMVADFDPQTRKVRAALKSWSDDTEQFKTLYAPGVTYRYRIAGNGGLEELGKDEHGVEDSVVVPFVNRGRVLRLDKARRVAPPGKSELAPIVPLSDAACKAATDMMVAAETVAIPSRYIWGMSKDEFIDPQGNPVSPWTTVLGKMLSHEDKDLVAGQWPAADLSNFHETINELARIVAAVAALPPHYLGFSTDNPASADAIRSNEARLVKRAERKQTSFGESWEQVLNLSWRIVKGDWNPDARRLETRWRDAATPTVGQKADAVTKLVISGVIPHQQAREDLGYTDAQVTNMDGWDKENAAKALAAMPPPPVAPGMTVPSGMGSA